MNVYIVRMTWLFDYEAEDIIKGAFSTKEKAEAFIMQDCPTATYDSTWDSWDGHDKNDTCYDILEMEVK